MGSGYNTKILIQNKTLNMTIMKKQFCALPFSYSCLQAAAFGGSMELEPITPMQVQPLRL